MIKNENFIDLIMNHLNHTRINGQDDERELAIFINKYGKIFNHSFEKIVFKCIEQNVDSLTIDFVIRNSAIKLNNNTLFLMLKKSVEHNTFNNMQYWFNQFEYKFNDNQKNELIYSLCKSLNLISLANQYPVNDNSPWDFIYKNYNLSETEFKNNFKKKLLKIINDYSDFDKQSQLDEVMKSIIPLRDQDFIQMLFDVNYNIEGLVERIKIKTNPNEEDYMERYSNIIRDIFYNYNYDIFNLFLERGLDLENSFKKFNEDFFEELVNNCCNNDQIKTKKLEVISSFIENVCDSGFDFTYLGSRDTYEEKPFLINLINHIENNSLDLSESTINLLKIFFENNYINLNAIDKKTGDTALMISSLSYNEKLSELLLLYGADPNIKNFEGKSVFDVSGQNIISTLKEKYKLTEILSENNSSICNKKNRI